MTTGLTSHHAHVVWSGDKSDLRAHTVRLADQTVDGSSAKELGGDGSKADPEELFVASLSACHMLWFLDFARRARLRVEAYDDEPEGVMNGRAFTRVVLRPRVELSGDAPAHLIEELHRRAHDACFIANSVRCSVEVEPR